MTLHCQLSIVNCLCMHEFDEPAESSSPSEPVVLPPPLPTFPIQPPFKEILLVYIVCCALLILVGGFLQELDALNGLLVTELILILWPPILYVWWKRYSFRSSFHLAPTRILNGVLSIFSAVALFILVGQLAQFQEFLLPHSQEYQELWEQTLQQFHRYPLPVTLLVMAVLPGVCEELFFRGFLLWGFRGRCSDRAAVLWVGVLFGIFHFDPYRLLSVTLLGMFFGYLVVQTRSIIPAMLAHSVNNSIAVTASYFLMEYQGGESELEAVPNDLSLGQLAWAVLPTICWAALGFLVMIWLLRYVNTRHQR